MLKIEKDIYCLKNLDVEKCIKRAGELYEQQKKDLPSFQEGIRSRQVRCAIQAIIEEIKSVC